MPTDNTPTAIDLAINLPVGAIEVFASDRADTVVTVSATNPAKAVDRRGAEETRSTSTASASPSLARSPASAFSAQPNLSTCWSSCLRGRGSLPISVSAPCVPSDALAPPASRHRPAP